MPASICCTNCRTKYSLLNREAGCSSCALSFCKKCLAYRSIIPNLSPHPMIVCYNCYQTLEAAKLKPAVVITSTPLPESSGSSKNWWGDGLPPPSFRQQFRQPEPKKERNFQEVRSENSNSLEDLEKRRANLREDVEKPEKLAEPLSISEIEERLARLRGCDVEVIRNPRSWFTSSENIEINAKTPAELMKIAEDRARIEEKDDKYEKEDMEELEARRRRIFEEEREDEVQDTSVRDSVVSEATKEEMNEINSLLVDAEKKVAESRKQEEKDAAELRTLMRNTRQKSLDAMQWNEKITKEIGGFWDRQNEKSEKEEEDEDDKSLDEETFKKILHEAENAADSPPQPAEPAAQSSSSPKKKGFFGKFFGKDSKN